MSGILIVTNEFDPHADIVVSKLSSPVFRLDINDLVSGETTFVVEGSMAQFKGKNKSIPLSEVNVVYWRKPLIEPKSLPDKSKEVLNEWTFMLDNLAAILAHVQWLNHPAIYWRASKKLYQLILATEIGFNVPRFYFSNRPREAVKKLDQNKLIFKSIVTQHSLQGVSLENNFGNVLLNREDVDDSDTTPSLLQNYIEKVAEWRITVVDENIFPARITTNEKYVDIKEVKKTDVVHHSVPEQIEKDLLMFMKKASLDFCAFDFLEDSSGKFWFLEANPNGQWLWIEAITGQNISGAIAELLDSRQSKNTSHGTKSLIQFAPLQLTANQKT